MLDYAAFCLLMFAISSIVIVWSANRTLEDIKAEKARAEDEKRREEKLKDAKRRWDESMEAIKELWV